MTAAALASLVCAASSIYARPQPTADECLERAVEITQAAEAHGVDSILMLAIDVQECDLREHADVALKKGRRVVGYDACPMGLRIMSSEAAELSSAEIYEMAARRMSAWQSECQKKGRGSVRRCVARRWNPGNPAYASQVLSFAAVLGGKRPKMEDVKRLTRRSVGIGVKLRRAVARLAGRS